MSTQADDHQSQRKRDMADVDQDLKMMMESREADGMAASLAKKVSKECLNLGQKDSPKTFRFMSLPVELRLAVYKELLVSPGGIHISKENKGWKLIVRHCSRCAVFEVCSKRCKFYRRKQRYCSENQRFPKKCRVAPNVLATCETIRGEAQDFLWRQKWHFTDPETLHAFLMLLKPTSIGRLSDITIYNRLNNRDIRKSTLLAPLQYALGLRALRFNEGIRLSLQALQTSIDSARAAQGPNTTEGTIYKQAGENLAIDLLKMLFPFVRAFAVRKGVEGVLGVIKFHRDDIHLKPRDVDFEQIVSGGLKARLVQLLGPENARLKDQV